jgi:hypothetical protein
MGLIDDFVQGVSKEVGKVQARSQEMLQSYNLTAQIRELERKKSTKLLEIGRLIFDKYERNTDVPETLLKEKVSEIVGYDHEINLLQNELDGLRMQSDPNTPTSKKADAKAGFNPTPGFECPRCHAPASKDKSFCPICGEPLKKSDGGDDVVDVEPNGGTER